MTNYTPFQQHSINLIRDQYSVEVVPKNKTVLKFGQNLDVDNSNEETVMDLQGNERAETYVSTNAIDRIVSSDAGNTQTVTIEGHTISGGVFTFVVQTATLNGQTAVTLATPLARVSRVYNTGSTAFAASSRVYVYEDSTISSGVPTDNTKIHIVVPQDENQSFKASTTFSNVDYFAISSVYGGVNKTTNSVVDFKLKVREVNGVFRTQIKWTAARDSSYVIPLEEQPLIVPPNSDVLITALPTANNTEVTAWFNGEIFILRSEI